MSPVNSVWLIVEQYFFDSPISRGLAILGVYYCCLRREDGAIEGQLST